MAFNNATDFIKPHLNESVKSHIEYDGLNRMEYVYTAIEVARHGDQCLVTQYQYVGVTGRISGTKEGLSTWNSAWDF